MRWTWFPALLLLGAWLGHVEAAAPMPARSAQRAGVSPAADDARRVADRIDQLIGATHIKERVTPAPLSSDAAFLRRVSLDIVGRVPQVSEARRFIGEDSPEKRAAAVERLLDSPGYVNHFTSMWLTLLMPESSADFQKRYMLPGVHTWLRQHFAANTPYDQIVRELVALPMNQPNNRMNRLTEFPGGGNDQNSPMSFYIAKSGKPEEIAASISRLFLGVRLECAQCHDHPFGKWKREEFWSQASFFAGLKGNMQGDFFYGPLREISDRRELTIPNTDRVAQARFLDGKVPKWKFKVSARTTLADWMTAKDNPFLAKAIVNRMWAHFFGIGLVEPIDDLVEDNLASHPEVLDLLVKEFVAHDFDLKFLIRAITLTRTYQLSSTTETARNSDPRLYARMQVKGLTGEQLYDSLTMAAGIRDGTNFQQRLYNFGSPRGNFLDRFTDQEKRTEYHTSIPQALTMMNNQLILDATHPDRSETLAAVTSSSFMSTPAKIETLFLAALSRKPTSTEAAKFAAYVERDKSETARKKALSDVFWALLNSTEFKFNH